MGPAAAQPHIGPSQAAEDYATASPRTAAPLGWPAQQTTDLAARIVVTPASSGRRAVSCLSATSEWALAAVTSSASSHGAYAR